MNILKKGIDKILNKFGYLSAKQINAMDRMLSGNQITSQTPLELKKIRIQAVFDPYLHVPGFRPEEPLSREFNVERIHHFRDSFIRDMKQKLYKELDRYIWAEIKRTSDDPRQYPNTLYSELIQLEIQVYQKID